MWRLVLLLCCLTWPTTFLSAVSITEICWMGDSVSANNEWIELYNPSTNAIDMSGWQVRDGANLTINLSGSVPAESYVLLERNRSSEAYLTKPPFLVYTGSLVNTGATLTLYRADGGVEDQVAGGENWQTTGGDNTTKETAQYTSSGWVTAAPTPLKVTTGRASPPSDDGNPDDEEEQSSTTTPKNTSTSSSSSHKKSSASETVQLTLQPITLAVDVSMQKTAYVQQPVAVAATPKGIGRHLMPSVTYEWNFGDMATGTGATTTHTYRYPGTYVVTLYASYKRQTHVTRHEITVLPVSITMTRNAEGDVQVHNDAQFDIDVSGYKVVGTKQAVFPPRSIMSAKSTVTIPWQQVTDGPDHTAVVLDTRGKTLALSPYAVSAVEVETFPLVAQREVVAVEPIESMPEPAFTFATTTASLSFIATSSELLQGDLQEPVPTRDESARTDGQSETSPISSHVSIPWIGFLLVLIIAAGVILMPLRREAKISETVDK